MRFASRSQTGLRQSANDVIAHYFNGLGYFCRAQALTHVILFDNARRTGSQ
jgi:hypothetical protein